jgi:plasmid stabilization system protein ParE
MPDNSLDIFYTDKALANLTEIKNFILLRFTQREVENFYKLLRNFEKTVSTFPDIYPVNFKNEAIRRAVMSKQLSVFYQIIDIGISVVAILDNRMDYNQWPS